MDAINLLTESQPAANNDLAEKFLIYINNNDIAIYGYTYI